ncbi:carbohydrate-binding protein [Metabacillus litoralis]|uniref:Carbohydrate-binding protein n=1 Tax=Metabacillus litoralis TaxID=152268 RepID=A0A5C6W4E3_9BACI|nr:glycoside hydrolase family 3 protein [Metabacillus litoralis]TXC90686.1 carbohydrate-binding protein [Metabacillus litoralis]
MEKIAEKKSYKFPFQNPNLPLETRVNDLTSRFTLEEKVHLMCQYQPAIERLEINAHKQGTEAAHGMAWLGKATTFPQTIGLACTWNPELMKEIGDVISTEARAFYKKNPEINGLTLWAPTVDMERDPRWGRTEEAYGEDPYLTGKLTSSLVKGIQGDHPFFFKAVATLKHFLANNNEIDRGSCSASIDPRNMHEYYLKAFELPFKEGGAHSMMTAYNSINGTPAILHPYVKEIVKEQWGMNGFVVSDAADLLGVVRDHGYYEHHSQSVADAIKNGIDSMTDDFDETTKAIFEALEKNLIKENDLDRALRNTFRVRFRLGEFDPIENNPYSAIPESIICDQKHAEVSSQAAKESIVLLKNENNLLPLNKEKLNKVSVIGPLGDIVYRDWYSGDFPYSITPYDGIKNKLEGKQVTFHSGNDKVILKKASKFIGLGMDENSPLLANKQKKEEAARFELSDWGWGSYTARSLDNGKYVTSADDKNITASADEIYGWFVKEVLHLQPESQNEFKLSTWNNQAVVEDEDGKLKISEDTDVTNSVLLEKEIIENGMEEAIKAAKESDVAIVFVGNNPVVNGKEEMDRPDISLAQAQEQLIKEVYKVNPNTIVVVIGSYPFAINWVDENIPAILYTSHAGQELGNAISDVLFGDYNPAGRLNMTWYRSVDQLPDILDYDIIKGKRTYMYFDGEELYPFGHGKSYANFEYSDFRVSENEINEHGEVTVIVKLKNNSTYAGDEVVQLYFRSLQSRFKRPLKQLIGFKRIFIEAGETTEVELKVKASDLAVWDVTRDKYCVETGEYELMIGQSSTDIMLQETLKVNGEVIPPRNLYVNTKAENYDDYQDVVINECKEGGHSVQTKDGSWVMYSDVDFSKGVQSIEARVSNNSEQTKIDIYLEHPQGEKIGEIVVSNTGDKQNWHTVTGAVQLKESIEHTKVYFVCKGEVLVSYFRFIA